MVEALNIYRHGSGPPISLLHGWGMNAAIFEPLLELDGFDFTTWRIDLPGHGRSAWVELDFDAQVELLGAQLPPSTLLGWSLGGLFAVRLAQRFPGKFERLALVAFNPCFVQRPGWRCAVEADVFDDFAQALCSDWHATIKRFIGLQLKGADEARILIRRVVDLLRQGGEPHQAALHEGLALLRNYDARDDLKSLQQPTMLVLGERDTLVPVDLQTQIRQLAPAIRVECVARSAHVPFISHPNHFGELIRGFTQSSQAGQKGRQASI